MTAGRGLLFGEGPAACPFVALDRDRERRADEPDSRHRCYATPTPEPRALAHQRNYCLTPNFSGCPIFQDWAIRAAARPVPLRPVPPALALIEEERPVGEPMLSANDDAAGEHGTAPDQAGLFSDAAPPATVMPAPPPMPTFRLTAPVEPESASPHIVPAPGPAIIPPPARPSATASAAPAAQSAQTPRIASAGRVLGPAPMPPATPKPTPSKPIKTNPTLRREDIVPAWERSHYDIPEPTRASRRRGGGFSRVTLLFTALALVALAAVVVLLGPVLLRGPAAAPTTRPTTTPIGSPSPSPTAAASATPQASWQTYTIKLGDNLYAIATSFGITYDQLLAANPQITNPNYIRAGDVINIPPPNFVAPSHSPAGASATPAGSSATP